MRVIHKFGRMVGDAIEGPVEAVSQKVGEYVDESKIEALLSGKGDTYKRAFFEAYRYADRHDYHKYPNFDERFMDSDNLSNIDFHVQDVTSIREGKSKILDDGAICLFSDPFNYSAYFYVPQIESDHLSDCIVLVIGSHDDVLRYEGNKTKQLSVGNVPQFGCVRAVSTVDKDGNKQRVIDAEEYSYEQQADAVIQILSRFDIDKATPSEQELMYQLRDCAMGIIGYELNSVLCGLHNASNRVEYSQAYAETKEALDGKSLTEALSYCENERDKFEVQHLMSEKLRKKEQKKQTTQENIDNTYKSVDEKRRESYKI